MGFRVSDRRELSSSWEMIATGLKPKSAKELEGEKSFPNRRYDRTFHFIKVQTQRGFQDLELENSKGQPIAKLLKRFKLRLFSWSPDSTRAVFSVWMDDTGNGGGDHIRTYVVNGDGTNVREIAEEELSSLVWLSSDQFLEKVKYTLWKVNLPKEERERIVPIFTPGWCKKLNSASKLYTIQIKPKSSYQTSKRLGYPVYLIGGGGAYRVGIGGYRDSVEAMETAEDIRQELKLDYRIKKVEANSIYLPVEFGYVPSPKGDKVAFIRNDGYSIYWCSELWMKNSDGTDEIRVVSYMANFDERFFRSR